MKKIAFLTALMMAFSCGLAFSEDLASDGTYSTGQDLTILGTDGDLTLKLSNNVLLSYKKSATGGLGYSVASYHTSGTRTYGSSSGDANIFWAEGTAIDPPTAPTGTESANFVNTTWTAL